MLSLSKRLSSNLRPRTKPRCTSCTSASACLANVTLAAHAAFLHATFFCDVLQSVSSRTPARPARSCVRPSRGEVLAMKTMSASLKLVGGASPAASDKQRSWRMRAPSAAAQLQHEKLRPSGPGALIGQPLRNHLRATWGKFHPKSIRFGRRRPAPPPPVTDAQRTRSTRPAACSAT